MLIALALAVLGADLLYPPDSQGTGWLVYAAAAVLAAFAFANLQQREGEKLLLGRPAPYASPARVGASVLVLLAGLALAVVTVVGLATGQDPMTMRWTWLASLALLIGGSVALGALGTRPVESVHQPVRHARRLLWLELAGVLGLVALAVFLRVYRLNQMPPGVFVDETNAALDALHIMEGRPDSPFGTGWFETPTLYAYYLVALFKALGTSFVALKAASLIPSILTVAAIYPLARLLFGIPTAFAATFILATNRWHITMSRWGWNEVAPLLFLIGALYFLVRGTRDRRASDFALAGLLLGLGHYTYLASRLAVLAVVLYLLYRVLFERGFLRRHWRGLVLFTLLYLATFGPLLQTYLQNPFTFSNRSRQVSIIHDMQDYYQQQRMPAPRLVGYALAAVGLPKEVSLLPLQESVLRHLEMFHVAGDRNPRHNLPGAPMLDPIIGSLLLLSLGYALWHLGRPRSGGHRYALLLLWLFVPLLGGMLTRLDEAPQAYRTLTVVGAVALLSGDAAVRTTRVLAAALGQTAAADRNAWLRAVPGVAVALVLGLAALLNYRLYFDVQAEDGRVWQAFSPVETAVAIEVAAQMDERSFYLSPRLYYYSPLRFLTYRSHADGGGGLEAPPYQLAEPVTDLPLSDPFGQDAVFLLDTYYEDVPDLFTRYYPGARFEMVQGPGGQPLYLSVAVSGEEVAGRMGMQGVYTTTAGQPPVQQPYAGAPRFSWPPDLAQSADPATATAAWTGALQLPKTGIYNFHLSDAAQLVIDGTPVSGPKMLGKGLHAVEIAQTRPATNTEIVLSWQPPGQDAAEPIPPNFFMNVAPQDHGLRGDYYLGELWEGEPAFSRVDPLLLFAWSEQEPWPAPFSVRWTGTLMAPVDGAYRLQLNADDGVRLWIDGQLVGESVAPDTVNLVDTLVQLSAGAHDVRIDYFQRGGGKGLEFWWQPPGDHLRPVPPSALSP